MTTRNAAPSLQAEEAVADPNSARPCLACGHAVPHNRGDYEDTYLRCEHEEPERYVGSDCGHKKYNAKCDEKDDEGGCWTLNVDCRCSEEDRLIADLSSTIATLRQALARYGRHDGNCGVNVCAECAPWPVEICDCPAGAPTLPCSCGLSAALDEKGE